MGHRQGRHSSLSGLTTGTNQAEIIQCFWTQAGGKGRTAAIRCTNTEKQSRFSTGTEKGHTETGNVQVCGWAGTIEGVKQLTTQVASCRCGKYRPCTTGFPGRPLLGPLPRGESASDCNKLLLNFWSMELILRCLETRSQANTSAHRSGHHCDCLTAPPPLPQTRRLHSAQGLRSTARSTSRRPTPTCACCPGTRPSPGVVKSLRQDFRPPHGNWPYKELLYEKPESEPSLTEGPRSTCPLPTSLSSAVTHRFFKGKPTGRSPLPQVGAQAGSAPPFSRDTILGR